MSDEKRIINNKEYTIVEMLTSENNISDRSIFTYNQVTNNELRKDTLFILEHFEMDHAYIKYEKTIVNRRV